MANTVDLHLLPRIDQQNDTRRTSSPGGCCCFSKSRRTLKTVLGESFWEILFWRGSVVSRGHRFPARPASSTG
ncbi:MAG: hypothetical protein EOR84_18975 [Mesorhizobium sp.]|nr:MAG: hypothetical protein EOR84_18975 [Mesorhizobium sp.]